MSSLTPILNAGFAFAAEQLPPDTRPVIALRPSSYSCCQYEIVTARYMPAYRPFRRGATCPATTSLKAAPARCLPGLLPTPF